MNKEETVADTNACVLVSVIVSSVVPPAPMVETEKALEIVGLASETVSVSAAEQTPATVQDTEAFVLVTVAGGVIVAIFVTWVCACAREFASRKSIAVAANPSVRQTCSANLP